MPDQFDDDTITLGHAAGDSANGSFTFNTTIKLGNGVS
jgi:hypothetical protein